MLLGKWNYTTHKYEPYWVPDSANIVLNSKNLGDIAQCAACLQPERIGFMYTSKTIHINGGLGYSVCQDCYDDELKEEEESFKKGTINARNNIPGS